MPRRAMSKTLPRWCWRLAVPGVALATALAASPGDGGAAPAPMHPRRFVNSVGMACVLIPRGTFLMGSPDGEEGRKPTETAHQVTITRSFYLSAHEVTQGQYEDVVG